MSHLTEQDRHMIANLLDAGLSPLDYLYSVRLKFAAGKLRNTNLRIKEIARMSGFLSSARFCTVFQEKYGMTPGDYRKKELEKKQS